ncbi:putative membrane protein, partial [Vibrio parahaemolyticus AQ3810]
RDTWRLLTPILSAGTVCITVWQPLLWYSWCSLC